MAFLRRTGVDLAAMENAVCVRRVRRAVHVRRVAGRVLVHEGQCQQGDADEAPGALHEVRLSSLPRAWRAILTPESGTLQDP